MALRTAADLRSVLELTTELLHVRGYPHISALLLPRLARVVGGDAATLSHLDLRTRREVALMWPPSRADRQTLAPYPAVADTHPLRAPLRAALRDAAPLRTALRISDFRSARQWRNTPLYQHVLRETSDQLCLPLLARGSVVHVVALSRVRGSFTDRQRSLLESAAPHLRAALARARAGEASALQLAPWLGQVSTSAAPGLADPAVDRASMPLSAREREVLELVADGLTDAQIARRLTVAPATVSKRLHRLYQRLGVTNRAAAAQRWTVHTARAVPSGQVGGSAQWPM
ncbi:MAG TPA: helix-turn-helix transcriptional regulator [Jatrophihabitans sp.]|nr:helix-turn-helix transcriptional regulator [Jatrophihabitans sp.]